MTELLGAPVAAALTEKLKRDIDGLAGRGMTPRLAVMRVGERDDDIAYERGIIKRFASAGAEAAVTVLPDGVSQERFDAELERLNGDLSVHGILVFRPLPAPLSEERAKRLIAPEKDVDCMSPQGLAHLFACDGDGFPPCTPQAVIELLDYYGIDPAGKRVAVVGRSLVVGKPLAVLLLARNATVTVCHTRTADLASECRRADIIAACAGRAGLITSDFITPEQIIIDVGVNFSGGKLCGDVDYGGVADIVSAITPVPGGVGAVTTAVLLKHTVSAAKKAAGI